MPDFKNIKNIIFDLGGVLFDIDYHLTANAFQQLGVTDFDRFYSQAKQNDWFDKFEKGEVENQAMRNYLKTFLPPATTDEQIDTAWCAMLIGMPDYKFEMLSKLKKHFQLFLLSNTNGIHLPEVNQMISVQTPGKKLVDYFSKTYFSNEIKMRKPDVEIFEFVIRENNLIPDETLFIDDSPQHLIGAEKAGLQTFLITKENTTEKFFSDFIS